MSIDNNQAAPLRLLQAASASESPQSARLAVADTSRSAGTPGFKSLMGGNQDQSESKADPQLFEQQAIPADSARVSPDRCDATDPQGRQHWLQMMKSHFDVENALGDNLTSSEDGMPQTDIDPALVLSPVVQNELSTEFSESLAAPTGALQAGLPGGYQLPHEGQTIAASSPLQTVLPATGGDSPLEISVVPGSMSAVDPLAESIRGGLDNAPLSAIARDRIVSVEGLPGRGQRSAAGDGSVAKTAVAAALDSIAIESEDADGSKSLDTERKVAADNLVERWQRSPGAALDAVTTARSADLLLKTPLQSTAPAIVATGGQPAAANSSALSPELASLNLAQPGSSQQIAPALGERVALMLNHQLSSAEIRIDPPHLGKLDIQIQVKDDTATVIIHTQHAQTRDLIDASSLRLREFLQEAGYQTVDVNVSHGGLAQDQDNHTAQGDESAAVPADGEVGELTGDHMAQQMMYLETGERLVDFFA